MTIEEVKQKLHLFIETTSEKKVMALYTLLIGDEDDSEYDYDDKTIAMLEQRAEDVFSGKVKGLTKEEFFDNLKARKKE